MDRRDKLLWGLIVVSAGLVLALAVAIWGAAAGWWWDGPGVPW